MKYIIAFSLFAMTACASPQPFSPTVTASLTSAMLASGASPAKCDCMISEVQKKVSQDDVVLWNANGNIGAPQDARVTQAIKDAAAACQGK